MTIPQAIKQNLGRDTVKQVSRSLLKACKQGNLVLARPNKLTLLSVYRLSRRWNSHLCSRTAYSDESEE